MKSPSIAAVIPARLGSTRLSRKVLRELAGRPMVEWVWRAAMASGLHGPRAGGHRFGGSGGHLPHARHSRRHDFPCLRQRFGPRLRSGPQPRRRHLRQHPGRRAHAHRRLLPPLLALFDRPDVQVGTLAVHCPEAEIANPNAVKVVTALDGRALYFSRSTIPYDRDRTGFTGIASTWASMPIASLRWSGSPPCRLAGSNNWNASNNSGSSKTESTSMLRKPQPTPSAWIPKRTWPGPKRY